VPLAHLRSRFGVLKMLNQLVAAVIVPVANLWSMNSWSLGSRLRNSKHLLFLEAKMAILTQSLQVRLACSRFYSSERVCFPPDRVSSAAAHLFEGKGPTERDPQPT
jgi:hypothetical protein